MALERIECSSSLENLEWICCANKSLITAVCDFLQASISGLDLPAVGSAFLKQESGNFMPPSS